MHHGTSHKDMSHSPLVLPSFLRHGLIPPPPIYLSHGRSLISRSRRSLGARLRSPFADPRMVDRGRRRPISPPRGRWPLPLRQHCRPSSIPVQSDSAGRHTEELAGIRQGGVHDQLLELLQVSVQICLMHLIDHRIEHEKAC
jgi:hypothetical protein